MNICLDKVIDNLSDDEVLDILSSGNSYGQDYRAYIEENPNQKAQMIKNIKRAMKKVAVFTGIAAGTGDILIQGKRTNRR